MPHLSWSTVQRLPADVAPPAPRTEFSSGIVHIGPGNFHRSHQGFFMDAVRRRDPAWGMRSVGIMPGDAPLLEALHRQDGLFTIREMSAASVTHRVSGAIAAVNRPGDHAQILDWLEEPRTRIVTLTITEGGYYIDPRTGTFDADHPALAAEWEAEQPRTVFGYLVRALARRRDEGTPPFTVLSCDNLIGNGTAARNALVGFARAADPALSAWIEETVATPSSMVDGITPTATARDRASVSDAVGLTDDAAVTCEPFRQWVIEDHFPTGRPRWEDVGVDVVDDVAPFEHMKLRMLNAAHQVMAHLGALAGLDHIHDVCTDEDLGGLLEVFWRTEAQPMIPSVPGVDLDDYRETLRRRFSNPAIADTVARNAAQASDRIPGFVLPTVADNLASGGPVDVGALVVAAWARGLHGRDDRGQPLTPVDARLDELLPLVTRGPGVPLDLLQHPQLASVGGHPRFREAFIDAWTSLVAHGARGAARALVRRKDTP